MIPPLRCSIVPRFWADWRKTPIRRTAVREIWRLSLGNMGDQLKVPTETPVHHIAVVLGGLRGALNWAAKRRKSLGQLYV